MELRMQTLTGKILYSMLFVVVLPILLTIWAAKTENVIKLQVLDLPYFGFAFAIVGTLLMAAGISGLYIYGNGLPMNPFPPEKFVTKGIYRFISHPIYVGAVLLSVGISIYMQSPSGLWLISSILMFGCASLVLGFEKEDLRKRFGALQFKPLICIPYSSEHPVTVCDRISTYILVLTPLAILYPLVLLMGSSDNTIITNIAVESSIPVIEFTVVFYLMIFPLVMVLPILIKSKKDMRDFMISGSIAIGIGLFLKIILPFTAPAKPFAVQSSLGEFLEFVRLYHASFLTFPAFPVIWAFLTALFYEKRFPFLHYLWKLLPVLISLSCITTGLYSIIDVLCGYLVFLIVKNRTMIWQLIQRASESIANSWKEWHFGPVRIINHGLYAGAGTAIGVFIVGMLIGKNNLPAILLVTVASVICAALWAQIIEGSAKLLRPMGYYGGVIGVILGSFIAHLLFGTDFILILAAFSVAGSWTQSFGRIRCLVQGCCHGRITTPNIGIRHWHERSRVCRIANLKNEYLHPTPVYSILSNIVVGLFLAKLWFAQASLPLITGLYLILPGLCRFVEEAYRGEPQTPIIGGLRLYQWMAVMGIIIGAVLTTIPHQLNSIAMQFSLDTLIISILLGLVATFATGVDFPNSIKRFSRLV